MVSGVMEDLLDLLTFVEPHRDLALVFSRPGLYLEAEDGVSKELLMGV